MVVTSALARTAAASDSPGPSKMRSTPSFAGRGPPATGGSPPQTPCLPWNASGNWSQPTATVFAYLSRFRGRSICHRLPPVATTGLHKGSILRCLIWRRCAFGERFAKRRRIPVGHRRLRPLGCMKAASHASAGRPGNSGVSTLAQAGAVSLGLLLCMESDSCDARRRRLAPASASANRGGDRADRESPSGRRTGARTSACRRR